MYYNKIGDCMRKKSCILNFRPDQDNIVYLQKLGIIDARSMTIRKDGPNFSKFINQLIRKFCVNGNKNLGYQATSDDLREAWVKHQISILSKEVDEHNDRIIELSTFLKTEKAAEEAKKILEKLL